MKIALIMMVVLFLSLQQQAPWNSPKEADKIVNPKPSDAASVKSGAQLYTTYCLMCHGAKGKGDGPAGVSLVPKPGNLLSPRLLASTDGSLYWKIKTGKAPMPVYELTDAQRWDIVNYLRELQKGAKTSK
jgi:mono/diheme cytochrome c family protein